MRVHECACCSRWAALIRQACGGWLGDEAREASSTTATDKWAEDCGRRGGRGSVAAWQDDDALRNGRAGRQTGCGLRLRLRTVGCGLRALSAPAPNHSGDGESLSHACCAMLCGIPARRAAVSALPWHGHSHMIGAMLAKRGELASERRGRQAGRGRTCYELPRTRRPRARTTRAGGAGRTAGARLRRLLLESGDGLLDCCGRAQRPGTAVGQPC